MQGNILPKWLAASHSCYSLEHLYCFFYRWPLQQQPKRLLPQQPKRRHLARPCSRWETWGLCLND